MSRKFTAFCNSIDDKKVKELVLKNSIITGGSIVSLLTNEKVNDYDIYFTDKETTKAVAQYYCKKFNELNKDRKNRLGKPLNAWVLDGEDVEKWKNGEKRISEIHPNWEGSDQPYSENINIPVMFWNMTPDRIKVIVDSDGIIGEKVEDVLDDADAIDYEKVVETEEKSGNKEPYRPIFLSSNAITLSDNIQLIVRFYGEAENIHENFDFIHATCYWRSSDGFLHLPSRALEAIINKELFYVGSKYPVCSIFRIKKFLKRGWNINAGQMLKIAMQISDLNLNDIATLEDQLVGVDSVYFYQVIEEIKKLDNFSMSAIIDRSYLMSAIIDRSYLVSVIDKIF